MWEVWEDGEEWEVWEDGEALILFPPSPHTPHTPHTPSSPSSPSSPQISYYQGPDMAKVIPGVCIFTNIICPLGEKQTPANSFVFNALRANL